MNHLTSIYQRLMDAGSALAAGKIVTDIFTNELRNQNYNKRGVKICSIS